MVLARASAEAGGKPLRRLTDLLEMAQDDVPECTNFIELLQRFESDKPEWIAKVWDSLDSDNNSVLSSNS